MKTWHFLIHCRWKLGSVLVLVSLLVGLEVTEGMFVLQLFALGGVSLARVLSLLVGCAHQDGLLAGGLDGIDARADLRHPLVRAAAGPLMIVPEKGLLGGNHPS